jgi:SP family myo-inositol transporter-like MFS transporter 13
MVKNHTKPKKLTSFCFFFLQGWRWMLGLAAVPAFLQLIGMFFFVPESPRWMIKHNKVDEARKVISKISGPQVAEEQIEQIQEGLRQESGHFRELFSADVRPALLVGLALQAFQQFCGINTAIYYSPTILKMAGYKKNSTAIWFSDAVAATNALFTCVSLYLVDRVGRRHLLLTSLVGLTIGLTSLGASFFLSDHLSKEGAGIMALCSLIFYVAFFAIGMGPVHISLLWIFFFFSYFVFFYSLFSTKKRCLGW